MKQANLKSIVDAYKNLNSDLSNLYFNYHSINIKSSELNDLDILVNELLKHDPRHHILDKYFIGFSIPQISKEFDLLRIGKDSVVNIELKKISTPEKIEKQLVRNTYYLGFLNIRVKVFLYESSGNIVYTLNERNTLIKSSIETIVETLKSQDVEVISNINDYFKPSDYLVSPFNSTQKFIDGKYFLTNHQEEIKAAVKKQLNLSSYSLISIKGSAGTGKTLLTYDIVKESRVNLDVLLVHCGILNLGHQTLRNEHEWNIVPVKNIEKKDLSLYQLIVIDEAQRIKKWQLLHIIEKVKKNSTKCIFSYDGNQTLRKEEHDAKIDLEIEAEITHSVFELTSKIRTNKEVASFIRSLFNKGKQIEKLNYSNIEIKYFSAVRTSRTYLVYLKRRHWKVINFTPSLYKLSYDDYNVPEESDNAHTVIGQEFDNVVAIIDEKFYYHENQLAVRHGKVYYDPLRMLAQIVSRTRVKLQIVIINNKEILERCLKILQDN
jgi:hypothetical protein